MSNQTTTTKIADASGRGSVAGYKVNFPARMRSYTESEIDAVVNVMRNAEAQTQGAYLRQFEADFKAYSGANYAFAVDNATNALRLAAILCRLGPGDEVIPHFAPRDRQIEEYRVSLGHERRTRL